MAFNFSLTVNSGATYDFGGTSAWHVDTPGSPVSMTLEVTGTEGSGAATPKLGTLRLDIDGPGTHYQINNQSGTSNPHTFNIVFPSGGPYTVIMRCDNTDDQGRDQNFGQPFYGEPPVPPDTTPPTISAPTYPASEVSEVSGQTYVKGSTVTVSYTGSDTGGSGLAGISIDGGSLQSSPASKTYTVTGDFTSTAYAKDGAGNQSGSVSKAFKKDNIAPTIDIDCTVSSSVPTGGSYNEVTDSAGAIRITINDSMSGPKEFEYRHVLYTIGSDGLSVGPETPDLDSGGNPVSPKVDWTVHSGSTLDIPLDPDYLNQVEVRNAKDMAGNISTGTAQSLYYQIIQSSPPMPTVTPPAVTINAGCAGGNDFWIYGPPNTPTTGYVHFQDLLVSPKFKQKIQSIYGLAAGDVDPFVQKLLDWPSWITHVDRRNDTGLHSGLGAGDYPHLGPGENQATMPPSRPFNWTSIGWGGRPWLNLDIYGGSVSTIFNDGKHSDFDAIGMGGGPGSAPCSSNGRASYGSGWYSGLYGRGANGSRQYTAVWLGTKNNSTYMPGPVQDHMYQYGHMWGYSTHGGWWSGTGGIRGRGHDWDGNKSHAHRRRDDFIIEAIHAWNPGTTYPSFAGHGLANGPCGFDRWLTQMGIDPVPGQPGFFKLLDCVPPTIHKLDASSKLVTAGNGKRYYIDYPVSNHICHFKVNAEDNEYGLDYAVFTKYKKTLGGSSFVEATSDVSPETVMFAGEQDQKVNSVSVTIDTQGMEDVYVDVEVFDKGGNSTTETMAARVISIDDADPQGGPGWSGSGATTTGPTTNIQTAGLRLENIPYMVGSKPYWNEKKVDIFIEYGDEYSGIDEAKLYINGTHESSITLPPTQTAILHAQIHTVLNGNLREGINNCQLWLKDLATNEWWSATLDFYIDMTDPDAYLEFSSPQLTIRENNGKLWTKENNLNVDLYYGDPGPDPSTVDAGATGVNSIPSNLNMPLSGNQKMGHNQGGLTVGKNDIYFSVKDKVEWEEDGAGSGPMTTDKITVWVDQTKPTGSIVRNSGQYVNLYGGLEYTNTTNFNVDLQHDDADSGLF